MTDDSLLAKLAEEFTAEMRAGKPTDIEGYARKYPKLAERIRELFPTLMMLEGVAGADDPVSGKPQVQLGLSPDSVFGQYRIKREIGRGGMGIVYEAVHLLLEKRVALKVLPVRTEMDAGHLERFFREARTAAGLHHTNIVPVFDVGQVAGTPYYAMEYIEGRGLDAVLRIMQSAISIDTSEVSPPDSEQETASEVQISSGKESHTDEQAKGPVRGSVDPSVRLRAGLPAQSEEYFRWVARMGIQAAEGLAHAHERKVIHRDIKPSNLLLDKRGVLWITDFGLARRIEDPAVTQSGVLLGTPRYMSPEQAQAAKRPMDQRSDIYSLGATLYELLTCRPVFKGKTPHEVISQILTREPVAPRRLNAEIPADLATIVMKAMAKRPEDRYQSADQLAEDLNRWLRMEPIKARPVGPVGRTIRWCRRNPRLAAVTATAAALILALSGLYYASLVKENTETRLALQRETEARAVADENNYVANLAAADLYLRSGSFADANQHLDACGLNLRGWEWHHLKLRANPALATLRLDSTPSKLMLSSDGSKILWQSKEENKIQGADIQSRELVPFPKSMTKEGTQITSPRYLIAFGRDGELIARTLWKSDFLTLANDTNPSYTARNKYDSRVGALNPLRNILEISRDLYGAAISKTEFSQAGVWRGEDSVFQYAYSMFGHVISAVFSPDGARFAAWTWDGKVRVCDTKSGNILCSLAGDSNAVTRVAFNPDGGSVVVGYHRGFARVWEVPSGVPIAILQNDTFPITHLAFRPDGKQIVSGSSDGTIRLWDSYSGKLVSIISSLKGSPLAFSQDGERLIVRSSDNKIHVIETKSGKEIISLSGHDGGITSAIFDAADSQIISGSADKTIRFWDTNSLSYVETLELPDSEVESVLWNPDGRHIAVEVSTWETVDQTVFSDPDSKSAAIWDAVSGETTSVFRWPTEKPGSISLSISPDASKVAMDYGVYNKVEEVYDSEIQLLNFAPSSKPLTLTGLKGSINRIIFSPDGKTIASVVDGRRITLWDASSGKLLRTMPGNEDWDTKLAFSPDSSRVMSVGGPFYANVGIWDAATGEPHAIFRGHRKSVIKAAFNPDGSRVLSASSDNTIRVWDSLTCKEYFSFSCAYGPSGLDVIFDEDGKRIYAGCGDGTLGVWDAETGKPLASSKSHTDSFRSLALSPDGSRLIAGVGPTIKIWDAVSLTPLLTIPAHDRNVEYVAFSPDGSMVLSLGADGKAKIWKSKRPD